MGTTAKVATTTGLATSDTDANGNTIVQRDGAGGIKANTATVATLVAANVAPTDVTETASFTAGVATDYFCDATGGAIVVTLPAASTANCPEYRFVKTDASGNTVTWTGALGVASLSAQYKGARLVSDGTNWYAV